MTIYQIHEYSGEYEDYRDIIVGSYLHKEKAILKTDVVRRIEAYKQMKANHCSLCPILDSDVTTDDFDVVAKRCSMYCRAAKITKDRFGYDCENYCFGWDEATYEIKEVEVEE